MAKQTQTPRKGSELLKSLYRHRSPKYRQGRTAGQSKSHLWTSSELPAWPSCLGFTFPRSKYPHARRLCDRGDGLSARLETPLTPFEQEIVDDVLLTSIQASYAGSVDFDDQIYMPALFGGSFPRFPNVLVDEDRTSDPAQHALLDKLTKVGCVACGDRWQAQFTISGVETGGDRQAPRPSSRWKEMPLSYSFRCPENIVKAVHWHVPHMRWIKTGGVYDVLPTLDPASIPEGAAIICRNNAPLFRAAFALLSHKVRVRLQALISALKSSNFSISRKPRGTPRSHLSKSSDRRVDARAVRKDQRSRLGYRR